MSVLAGYLHDVPQVSQFSRKRFLTAGTLGLILSNQPHLVVPVKERHGAAGNKYSLEYELLVLPMLVFLYHEILRYSPVIANGVVEASVVFWTSWVQGSGQAARRASVSQVRQPASVALHVHFEVWCALDVHLRVNNVWLLARTHSSICSNMIKTTLTRQVSVFLSSDLIISGTGRILLILSWQQETHCVDLLFPKGLLRNFHDNRSCHFNLHS